MARRFNIVDREPIWRRVEDAMDDAASDIRNAPGRNLRKQFPEFDNRNFGGGIAIGSLEAAIAIILERTIGVPFGSDVEITDTEPTSGGTIYTVNVDAPFENMAQARAFFESQTGFTSLLMDTYNVENVEVLRTRPARDTYQVEMLVED